MTTGLNESKILTKHISCKCKCKFDVKKFNSIKSGTMINVDTIPKIQKNIMHVKKFVFGILLLVVVKMLNI